MKLSVFSVIKNEEEMVEDMLKSAAGADEHIIVDTGSTDETLDICKDYTDKIYTDYKWNDDFSEAKNYAMSKCTGDFIIGLDADCRFEEGAIEKIKTFINETDKDSISLRLVWNDIKNRDTKYHWREKLFRKGAGHYIGKVHETFSVRGQENLDVAIVFLWSPRHRDDPERNLRILLKEDLSKPRTMFYLGREYFEHKKYDKAIEWLTHYVSVSTIPVECNEALLTIAKCYWQTGQGNKAREWALKAVVANPMFKEALLFLSKAYDSPWKEKWTTLSGAADNRDVLFVRT